MARSTSFPHYAFETACKNAGSNAVQTVIDKPLFKAMGMGKRRAIGGGSIAVTMPIERL